MNSGSLRIEARVLECMASSVRCRHCREAACISDEFHTIADKSPRRTYTSDVASLREASTGIELKRWRLCRTRFAKDLKKVRFAGGRRFLSLTGLSLASPSFFFPALLFTR
jgi:hypothetical protein